MASKHHQWVVDTFGVDPVQYSSKTGGGTDDRVGMVDPELKERPAFSPPAQSRQPTLRKGDTSPDGWVEYMQELLKVTVTGTYDDATLAAVKAFQKAQGCKVDGVVGNQTWSVLRHEKREKIGTDKRDPHSFTEKGAEARWFVADHFAKYQEGSDSVQFLIESVGDDTDISKHKATFRITPPGAKDGQVIEVPIGSKVEASPTGQGNRYTLTLEKFHARFPAPPGHPGQPYKVEAYLDAELGGDRWSGVVAVKPPAAPQPKKPAEPPPDVPPKHHEEPAEPKKTPVEPKPAEPKPPAQPEREKSLLELFKEGLGLAKRAVTEHAAFQAFLLKNLAKLAIHCPGEAKALGSGVASLGTELRALVVALGADATGVADVVSVPITIGLVVKIIKDIADLKTAFDGLVACAKSHGDDQAIITELNGHMAVVAGIEKDFERLAHDARKKIHL